jgi:hypothetical protein
MTATGNDAHLFPVGTLGYVIADQLNLPWIIVEAIVDIVNRERPEVDEMAIHEMAYNEGRELGLAAAIEAFRSEVETFRTRTAAALMEL